MLNFLKTKQRMRKMGANKIEKYFLKFGFKTERFVQKKT